MVDLLGSDEQKARFESYFGFRETPFGMTPDPRFFYSSALYREGLAALAYGIKAKKGFMLLTGEVGTGKTILLRKLMRHLESAVRFVFISSSHLTSYGLLDLITQDLGAASKDKNRLEMIHDLHEHLLQELGKGQTVALLIDEGQNLSDEALEGLCALSNLETDEEKLLQIVLVGQPELAVKLNKSSLRRLKQRIAIYHRLYALQTIGEVEDYVRHRVQVAGYDGPEIFTKESIEAIWYYSAGTPRLINVICDNSLAMACEASKKKISAYMVMKAAGGLLLERAIEAPKSGALDVGAPRVKGGPARLSSKRSPAAAVEIKTARPPEETAVPAREVEPAAPQPDAEPGIVAPEFFETMIRAAIEAMGPMAQVVLRDQISALGESREAFPQVKLNELIESFSREILNDAMRGRFQNMMSHEIDALKTLRDW
jgi:general secretion pathway protein A